MGSDSFAKKSMFSPAVCQRLKLCTSFVGLLGVFAAITFVLNDGKGMSHTTNSNNSDSNDVSPTGMSVAAISEYMSTNMNPSKLVTNLNPNNFVWHNKYDLVHVIETDFLQYQLDLVHMNQARLGLFETFTVPSLKQQTNKEFLWLIWTDPNLAGDFKQQLLDLVSTMPNAVVLGYRRDKKVDFRDLNGISEDEIDQALIAGSKKLLMNYYSASQDRLMIETRLDADDAFNKDFIEVIQQDAANSLGKTDLKTDYRIFCPEHHTEWRYYKPKEPENENGHLVHYHNPHFCINSGLTIGYQTQAKSRHLATLEQCNMNTWFQECKAAGYDGVSSYTIPGTTYIRHYCTAATSTRNIVARKAEAEEKEIQDVLMSRTPTAAGMKRVLGTESTYKSTFESVSAQNDAWDMIEKDFGVKKANVVALRRRMEADIENILKDALEGQCMPGHSCKASTKRKLMKLLDHVKSNAQRDMKN